MFENSGKGHILKNAVSSKKSTQGTVKCLKVFLEPLEKHFAWALLCPVIPSGLRGYLDLLKKEYKMTFGQHHSYQETIFTT